MEFIIRFAVNLFDLGIFWYYLRSFKKMKRVPMAAFAVYLVIMAAIWATVNSLEKAIPEPAYLSVDFASSSVINPVFFSTSTPIPFADIAVISTSILLSSADSEPT